MHVSSHACVSTCGLWRRRGYCPPSPWTLLDVGIIPRWIVTIIPGGRWRRLGGSRYRGLYVDLGGWHGDDWRVAIGIGIGPPVWPPIRPPVWPDADADTNPRASPPVASMPPTSMPPAPVASAPMPALPRIAWSRAAQEQRRQYDDHSHPLMPCSHRHHRPDITLFVSCETPRIHLILLVLYPQSPRHCHDRGQGHR
jgi:hypothetical protein